MRNILLFLTLVLVIFPANAQSFSDQIDAIKQLQEIVNFAEAEKCAESLLLLLENNDEKLIIYEILSGLCNRSQRYCESADYLLQAKEITSKPFEKNRYMTRIADLHYLSGEYSLAATLYKDRFLSKPEDEILFRCFCSLLKSDNWKDVEES